MHLHSRGSIQPLEWGPDPGRLNSVALIDWRRPTGHELVCRQGGRGVLDLG